MRCWRRWWNTTSSGTDCQSPGGLGIPAATPEVGGWSVWLDAAELESV